MLIILTLVSMACAQPGQLHVGFDVDDTILYVREVFDNMPVEMDDPHAVFAWANSNTARYARVIGPVLELVQYFHANGHKVYFITARHSDKGKALAKYLSKVVGFPVKVDENLFFSPKESLGEYRYTTKHHHMERLGLDLFYGDADSDIIAALKAGVHPVRIVRSDSSLATYSSNYFGGLSDDPDAKHPFTRDDITLFYDAHVGIFGESIYPVLYSGPGE